MLACVFAPGIIVFQAPTIRRKINRIFLAVFDFGYFKMKESSSEQEEKQKKGNNKPTIPRSGHGHMHVESVSTNL